MPPIIGRINKQAFGIARICGGRGAHYTERVVGKQLVRILESVDMSEERRHLARCRNPTTVRIHSGNVHPVRIAPSRTKVFYLVDRSVHQRISGNLHIDYSATL